MNKNDPAKWIIAFEKKFFTKTVTTSFLSHNLSIINFIENSLAVAINHAD